MYLYFLKKLILKFQEKHQISYSFKPGKTFDRKLPKTTTTTTILIIIIIIKKKKSKYVNDKS